MGLGVVLSRVGLAGSEGVIRGLDGQEPGLLLLGLGAVLLHGFRRGQGTLGWKKQLLVGLLLGVGVGLLGALPITLAASLGEGRLLALPLLLVCYAGWHIAGRWAPNERAPAAPPAPERSAGGPPDSETSNAG